MFLQSKLTGKRGPILSGGKAADMSSGSNHDEDEGIANLPLEDRVVALIQRMYRIPEKGLQELFRQLDLPSPEVPERKINILLVGNHSSGKSTFINWYVGENVQKTGVAMETCKFTVICHGKRRETLSAGAITQLFPKLEPLTRLQGVMDHLCGEVSEAAHNRFKLVNFIDTPGLVDGTERYTYDIDSAMDVIATMADLIFVFIDPQGQALCQRTLAHVERFCKTQPQKLSLWLTKCDLVEDEADRLKVMQQVSAELARRPAIARENLWLYPIFVPGLSKNQPTALNKLPESTKLIEKAIATHLQDNVLMKISSHCDDLKRTIEEKRDAERLRVQGRRFLSGSCAVIPVTLMLIVTILLGFYLVDRKTLKQWIVQMGAPQIIIHVWDQFHDIPSACEIPVLACALVIIACLGVWATSYSPATKKLDERTNDKIRQLNSIAGTVQQVQKEAKALYDEFLKDTLDL